MKTNYVMRLLLGAVIMLNFSPLGAMEGKRISPWHTQYQPPVKRTCNLEIDRNLCCPIGECDRNTDPLSSKQSLRLHLISKHNICPDCQGLGAFDSVSKLLEHCKERKHNAFLCKNCNQYVIALAKHKSSCAALPQTVKKNTSIQPVTQGISLRCPFFCQDVSFATPENLNRHLLAMHHACLDCSFKMKLVAFSSRRKLIEHFIHVKSNGVRSHNNFFYCEKCFNSDDCDDSKIFIGIYRDSLKNHERDHCPFKNNASGLSKEEINAEHYDQGAPVDSQEFDAFFTNTRATKDYFSAACPSLFETESALQLHIGIEHGEVS